jgi:hypothetical protein
MILALALASSGMVVSAFLAATTCAWADEIMDQVGPVGYPGMTVTVDEQGVQVRGYTFQNHGLKPSPWQARWIWLNGDSSAPAALFRHEVALESAPQQAKAWLTADAKYRLYVNGRLVSRGPVDIGRDYQGGSTHRWFYDFRELSSYFKPGANVIAAEVFREWPNSVSRGQPGFLFEAEITAVNGKKTIVKSDAGWRSEPALQFPNATTLDAGKERSGWRLPGFDDSAWPSSREVTDVWETLAPSEIPPLMEARYPVARVEGLPGSQVFTNDGSFKVGFDKVLSGYPLVKVKGGKRRDVEHAVPFAGDLQAGRGRADAGVSYDGRDRASFYSDVVKYHSTFENIGRGSHLYFPARGLQRGVRVQ